jgi:hypothetical protein
MQFECIFDFRFHLIRFVHITLAGIIFLQSGGVFALLQGIKLIHCWHVERHLEATHHVTDTFLLSASELELYRVDDHELEINGNLYDIIHLEDSDGRVLVQAYHDQDEEAINRHLRDGLNNNDPSGSEKSKTECLHKLLSMTYIVPVADHHSFASVRAEDFHPVSDNHICPSCLCRHAPPPEVIHN